MALYQDIQNFYGRQMHYLDSGATAEWAGTFTEDGVFEANAHPRPQSGRAEIEAAAQKTTAQLAEQGIQRRHWLGMLHIDEQPDGSILASTYALVINTAKGGATEIQLSCTCDDELVRAGDGFQVRHRQVRRDDLPR
jgi:hypothetical protein